MREDSESNADILIQCFSEEDRAGQLDVAQSKLDEKLRSLEYPANIPSFAKSDLLSMILIDQLNERTHELLKGPKDHKLFDKHFTNCLSMHEHIEKLVSEHHAETERYTGVGYEKEFYYHDTAVNILFEKGKQLEYLLEKARVFHLGK